MSTLKEGREISKSKLYPAQRQWPQSSGRLWHFILWIRIQLRRRRWPTEFCRPLQRSDLPNQLSKPNSESLEETSSLEGTEGINLPLGVEITQPSDSNSLDTNSFKVDLALEPSFSSRDLSMTPKIPLNRNTQRRLAQEIAKVYHSTSNNSPDSKPLVELKKHQAWPPGCSFLGSQAAQVPATVNFPDKNLTKVIIDSGSNITLILQKSLSEMQTPITLRQGQWVNLVQVTGNAFISGYVDIDLYFHTRMVLSRLKLRHM